MNHKSPSPFVQFNFEDSLRKYQPPLKKKVKRNFQISHHSIPPHLTSNSGLFCNPQSNSQNRNQQTQKRLSVMARGQPRQIDRKQTSQFVEEVVDYEEPETCNIWDKIQIVEEKEEEKAKWNRFREKVIEGMEQERNNIQKELEDEIAQEQGNPFHNIELSISSIQMFRNQLLNDLQILLSHQFLQQNCEEYSSQSNPISHQQHLSSPIQHLPSTNQHSPIEQSIKSGEEDVYKENILLNGARIRLQKKGICRYVSTRILTKTVETETVEEMKKRHPGLENVIEYLSELFQLGKSKTKVMMEFQ